MDVDSEPSACDEGAEAGGDSGERVPVVDVRPLLDACDLAPAEDVPDIGDRLREERGEKPDRMDAADPRQDLLEARDPRHRIERRERDHGTQDDEEEGLAPIPLHVRPAREPHPDV